MGKSPLEQSLHRLVTFYRNWRRRRPGQAILRRYPTASDRRRIEKLDQEWGWGGKKK